MKRAGLLSGIYAERNKGTCTESSTVLEGSKWGRRKILLLVFKHRNWGGFKKKKKAEKKPANVCRVFSTLISSSVWKHDAGCRNFSWCIKHTWLTPAKEKVFPSLQNPSHAQCQAHRQRSANGGGRRDAEEHSGSNKTDTVLFWLERDWKINTKFSKKNKFPQKGNDFYK